MEEILKKLKELAYRDNDFTDISVTIFDDGSGNVKNNNMKRIFGFGSISELRKKLDKETKK